MDYICNRPQVLAFFLKMRLLSPLFCTIVCLMTGVASTYAQMAIVNDEKPYLIYDGQWSEYETATRDNITEEPEQKVGLVLSGGGAKGLAHIGVIKALEEHRIPIDYVTGTSMGAIVGGMYVVGLTPQQMEDLVNSDQFKNMASGGIERKYKFYFMKEDLNPSWISMKVGKDLHGAGGFLARKNNPLT